MHVINIIFFSLMLSACSSIANVDYDKNINFSLLKSFNIEEKPLRVSADTRINSPFMQQRVVKEINATLTSKGFEYLKQDADLQVKYFLDIKQDIATQGSALSVGFGTSSYHSQIGYGFDMPIGETTSIDMFILTIDMVSTKTNKLLWRGSLGDSLYESASPETYNKLVTELVAEILEKFPPK